MEQTTKQIIKYLLLPLLLLCVVIWVANLRPRADGLMKVDFLDVGQGDAIFIQTHSGNQILIDGGPSSQVLSELGKSMPPFDRIIDLLILTHPDADHVTGLVEVMKRYKVKKILFTGVQVDTGVDREFEKLIDQNRVEKIYAQQGQRIWLDNSTVFDIYWPGPQPREAIKSANDTSIIGKLSFGQTQILLTGDASSKVEDVILPMFNLDSDLLKVGHHGSKTSTGPDFLQEVTPEFAVIQAGADNTYGHPTTEVLTALTSHTSQISRTDTEGTVRFVSDGITLKKID
jgi:competence protein ComEC